MEFDLNKFKNEYLEYLKHSLTGKTLENSTELTLPFFDRYNDALQVYLEVSENNPEEYIISDDSYVIRSLSDTGLSISEKRKESIKEICSKMGVKLNGNQLEIVSNEKDLVQKVHALAQTMLRVDDMYLTSQNRVTSYFLEDIKSYFDTHEIYYSDNITFVGKTGLTHSFDFLFQRNKNNDERLCKAMNNTTKNNMVNTIFAWNDIFTTRTSSKLIVLINDNNKVDYGIIEGLKQYNIETVLWSNIDEDVHYFQ
ncbi:MULTISPECIES: DUF1829 domain-containing protein [unclassified Breznakia]|uniref:DUF1829 domain-containing protein n=1 Tax=unclassified Breznakia TaxID=2623764 RepID=UPI002476108B|nr:MULTISPECIES: DUF1829 domain-containing protein [unclassified Breznakia]MDH6366592.1 hypothetical protein [Breznakia sp. PH1-1]MDH6403685.1 hypothetical protein [Breznakia sp. PF1-11]MDH6411394.1 hypothetical protein [Breznakia sp. PFB1-11]MDH6413875.1 hypothetical protein [Breznakia sp. PFB1-14]MDH6416305.1 hypothetical protein [Breznakia sp. PFB1-4]